MDVIVNGAGMIGIPGKHALQSRHDRRALRVRLSSARLPVVPWTEIHDRFRVQHRDVVVLRELRRDVGHDGGIGCIQLCPVRLRVLNISRRQGRNQRLLAWACLGGEGPRLLHCGEGRRHRFFRHRQVDVGSEHQRLAPEAHRAVGIELLRLTECALRLLMIEGIGQPQSLVEIDLRRRARSRDFVRERAEPVPYRRIGIGKRQRGRRGVRFRLRRLGLGRARGATKRRQKRGQRQSATAERVCHEAGA